MISYVKSFRDLLYPAACVGCGSSLLRGEEIICLGCEINLPVNPYLHHAQTPAMQVFSGRLPLVFANSYLYFSKAGITQSMIHALKYNDREDVGAYLGKRFAQALLPTLSHKPDVVLPVPLHKSKYKTRGYNQCTSIAIGMAKVFGCEVAHVAVKRVVANTSQTKLNRERRWDNVAGIFELNKPEELHGKHVLILDDTLTTGATLESCGHTVLQAENVQISIATLAIA